MAATLAVYASPASEYMSTDNKQDATTRKKFRFRVLAGGQTAAEYIAPDTNGPSAQWIKSPALGPGTWKILVDVRVTKNSDGSLVTTLEKSIDNYVVPRPFSWTNPVTKGNAPPGANVTTKLSSGGTTAEDTIAGHALNQIVTDGYTKVRGDNKACRHGPGKQQPQWNAAFIMADFCAKVPGFSSSGSKPQVLKDIFNNWKNRNCPN